MMLAVKERYELFKSSFNRILKEELAREAKIFQRIVFFVEKMKYNVIGFLCPNIIDYYNRYCNYYYRNIVKKMDKEDDEELLKEIRNMKMSFKKEIVSQKNRNYHYNPNNPTQFISWLESNKSIHMRGIKYNIGALDAIFCCIVFFPGISMSYLIFLTILEILSLFVNFQCVNLQNYNLERFQKSMEKLKMYEEKRKVEKCRKYRHCSEKFHEASKGKMDVLSVEEMVQSMETLEEIQELKSIVENTIKVRKLSKERKM